MGVVDLNGSIVSQVMEIGTAGDALVKNELCGIADHEILLVHAQQAALVIRVIRVEEQCQVLLNLSLVKVDASFHDALIHRSQVEEAQAGGVVVITGHIQVIETGSNREAAERNLIAGFGFGKPALVFHPRVRGLLLQMLLVKDLSEQAIVVV